MADESQFVATWIESLRSSRSRLEPALTVRLMTAYRLAGRLDRAADLAATLPTSTSAWPPLEAGRLGVERAALALAEGRPDRVDAELRQAARYFASLPRATVVRELLDVHVLTAQLDLSLERIPQAIAALKLAEHVVDRIDDGAWRAPVSMTLGHIAMALSDPRSAIKHYEAAVQRAPARGLQALDAHGQMAIALASIGRCEEARGHAYETIEVARAVGGSDVAVLLADAHDVLAIVETAADCPAAAVEACDEALNLLGDVVNDTLRLQLYLRRANALAMLARAEMATQWLQKAEKLLSDAPWLDLFDEQEVAAIRGRVLEACSDYAGAVALMMPAVDRLADSYMTGVLNLTLGRCALAIGDAAIARASVERASLNAERHGWVFFDCATSEPLWRVALASGDSRLVRIANKFLESSESMIPPAPPTTKLLIPIARPSTRIPAPLPSSPGRADLLESQSAEGELLLYITTTEGVSRVAASDVARATAGIPLIVNTLTHALRLNEREVSLERRRALEPLVVQLLRRAREGLSAEEVLRAAGGPGPDSADAEHRVRVLISRVRDLFGDASSVERIRDPGEHGKTRYRLSSALKFALIEPLFSPPEART